MEPRAEGLIGRITDCCKEALGENLAGVYLHGSLALGCFNWHKSDVDFIVVTRDAPTLNEKEALMERLLALEPICPEKGLEMSIVLERHCRDFIYPTPYELHFSNAHRESCRAGLRAYCTAMRGADKDLAAHFTIIGKAGITLCGKPKEDVFGAVPKEAYLDSILCDVEHAADDIAENPVYIILNLCRVSAYMEDGLILSKKQGAEWGLSNLPGKYAAIIGRAAECYGGAAPFPPCGEEALLAFAEHMTGRIFGKQERKG